MSRRTSAIASDRSLRLVGLTFCVLVAAALRFHGLDAKGLWIDEAYGADLVRVSLAKVWGDLAADHVPAYYSLLWGTVRALGDSEWALRLPSAVAGIAATFGTWAIGREAHAPKAALLAALLTALAPVAVYWSQEAKPEALWMAVAVASWYFLFAARGRKRPALWAGYWVVGLIGVYTFYYHVFIVAAQGLTLAVAAWRESERTGVMRWRRAGLWLLAHGALISSVLPWIYAHRERFISDVPTFAVATPLGPLEFLSVNGQSLLAGTVWGSASITPVTYLALLLTVTAVAGLAVHAPPGVPPIVLVALVSWAAIPLLGAFALQLFLPSYQSRYLLAVVPALYLLLALALVGVLSSRDLMASIVGVATLIVLLLTWRTMLGNVLDGAAYQHQGFREVSAYIRSSPHASDIVTGDPAWQAPGFRYYLRNLTSPAPALPPEFRHYLKGSQFLELPPDVIANQRAALERLRVLRDHGRDGVWLASYEGHPNRLAAAAALVADPTEESAGVRGVGARYYRFRSDAP